MPPRGSTTRLPASMPFRRHPLLRVLLPAAIVVWSVGCGADSGSESASTTSPTDQAPATTVTEDAAPPSSDAMATPSDDTSSPASLDREAPDLGAVVAVGEEFLLADLLALGVTPIASTATVDTAGFQGLDEFDTSGIEVLPQTTLSLEYLASLQPDTIVTLQFWVDQVGDGVLDGIADVVVVPDGLSSAEQIEALAELLGRPERAAAVLADLEAAESAAREEVGDGCAVSLAAVYSGPSVAAFVDGPTPIPTAFRTVGCEIVPGPAVAEPDGNGRAWLSGEQYGLLDQDVLVLLQSDTVEGEQQALADVQSGPIWSTLPAVQADNVVVVDRLGYPGAPGLIRFYGEIPSIVAD